MNRFALLAAWIVVGAVSRICSAAPATQPGTAPAGGPATQPAKELTLDLGNKVTMKLALIPAGKFLMGSPESEQRDAVKSATAAGVKEDDARKWFADESPQHEVTISKPFYMGVYEVTQEQYEQVMGKNPSNFKGAQNPVETVSWDDAVEFCKKLSAKTGKTVRLPTEAQWEYACRTGSKTRFSFGDRDEDLGDHGWYGYDSGNTGKQTHPVGGKKPNAFGLYDMHGNVWEWCVDWYDEKYYGNLPKTDPTGPADGSTRAMRDGSWNTTRATRGGSWNSYPRSCRSANRDGSARDYRGSLIGFRVVVGGAGVD